MNQKSVKGRVVTILLALGFLTDSCSGNLLSSVVNTSGYGDQGAYTNMVLNMNNSKWTAALKNYAAMTTSYQNQRSVQNLYAQALAGACGFSFLNFFNSLSGQSSSSLPFFLWMMQSFKSTTITMQETGGVTPSAASSTSDTYCAQAQQVMDNIQTNYGSWNSSEALFVAVYSLARIGMNLKYWLDPSGAGVVASTQDVCTNATTGIPDYYIKQVITGLALLIQNIAYLASSGFSSGSLASYCTTLTAINPAISICNDFTPSTISATDVKAMRSLLSMQYTGVGGLGTTLNGVGLYPQGSAVTAASTDPGSSSWQCTGLGASGPLSCCP